MKAEWWLAEPALTCYRFVSLYPLNPCLQEALNYCKSCSDYWLGILPLHGSRQREFLHHSLLLAGLC